MHRNMLIYCIIVWQWSKRITVWKRISPNLFVNKASTVTAPGDGVKWQTFKTQSWHFLRRTSNSSMLTKGLIRVQLVFLVTGIFFTFFWQQEAYLCWLSAQGGIHAFFRSCALNTARRWKSRKVLLKSAPIYSHSYSLQGLWKLHKKETWMWVGVKNLWAVWVSVTTCSAFNTAVRYHCLSSIFNCLCLHIETSLWTFSLNLYDSGGWSIVLISPVCKQTDKQSR